MPSVFRFDELNNTLHIVHRANRVNVDIITQTKEMVFSRRRRGVAVEAKAVIAFKPLLAERVDSKICLA